MTTSLESLIAKPCRFTFLAGPKIGQQCNQITNGSGRCIAHAGCGWANVPSHSCTRLLTKGDRAGQSCGKSTKFEDGICSVCRKIVLPISKEMVTPTVLNSEQRLYKRDFQVGEMVTTGSMKGPIIEMKQQKAVVQVENEQWSIWYGSLRKC